MAENSRPPSFSQDPITVEDQYTDFYYKHFSETFGHQPPDLDKLMPWRNQLSEINQQLAPSITLASTQSSVSKDLIVESRSAATEVPGLPAAQSRPSQDEEQIYPVEILVTEDQYADFYDKHLGGTDKEKDIYEENKLIQV